MKRRKGLHKTGSTDRQKLIAKLDIAFSKMIRERDALLGCITCGAQGKMDAGHFVRREKMSTRWNPFNCNSQCLRCNRFQGGNGAEYSYALGKKYTLDVPRLLVEKSREIKQWDIKELEQLLDACKKGYPVYVQLYNELI